MRSKRVVQDVQTLIEIKPTYRSGPLEQEFLRMTPCRTVSRHPLMRNVSEARAEQGVVMYSLQPSSVRILRSVRVANSPGKDCES